MNRFKEHADVLKMAKSKEKRDAIKWFHARRVFFSDDRGVGLELARESEHPDARYFASLFPGAAPQTKADAHAIFMAQRDEPRALCWAGECGTGLDLQLPGELLCRSAQGGYAWGQALVVPSQLASDRLSLLEKAMAWDEPCAFYFRACELRPSDEVEAARLWRQGAELGDSDCQFEYAVEGCSPNSLAQFEWLRRAALQAHFQSLLHLAKEAVESVAFYDRGGSGRLV